MDLKARCRRLTYLAHRWLGVAGCVLMLVWFLSGIVMLYVGYPKLTPAERLGSLPVLAADDCCISFAALAPAGQGLVLTSLRGRPTYVVSTADGPRAYSAQTGLPDGAVTESVAVAAAQAFWPRAAPRYGGLLQEDRWTHSRGLDRHRPLHQVWMDGPTSGTLYVSSATGEVVLDAPLAQQRWNYVGAWLHWLYMVRDRSVDPGWSWIVIVLSGACTLLAISGVVVGVWRWRFRGRYKSGARTPYREAWMRWHHVAGLLFSAFVCTWIFSGLMSMNPGGIFSDGGPGPDRQGMAAAGVSHPLADPRPVLRALQQAGFRPVQLEWRWLGGEAYVVARNAQADSRIVRAGAAGLAVQGQWDPQRVQAAAQALFPGARMQAQVLAQYDAYYYARHAQAMNGGAPRGLPALRLDFDTPGRHRVYVDLRTGAVSLDLGRAERVGRWLFYFLHSWDTPTLLNAGVARDVAIILLSLGGLALSATGVVLGTRRLAALRRRRRPAAPRA
ncbi:PepSY-associated TM helix domain-containing protein [Bordetella petrii]|uniref:PepSY-associated TM helix domain-containing protein n=1 Tax=Bordetella petrii TaxID=94624 RepID=UPI001E579F15|nr:PepSY-associated TM helix domain-containing protein [Bordetella petrii]MCD0505264.1 PepSY domain-containing protein [Bordetella petrii]